MGEKRELLTGEIKELKSSAYDILAALEFINNEYRNKVAELQKQLENTNKEIASKDQELRILLQEDKVAE